ncbi:N-acetyltransferase [Streptomyces sp. NBC_00212]|uniref:N-acetyltransferase n=1 Tax=Streptomyces sp. NBC_00212 TaxID=2975684 RepID=UPI0032448D39
MTDQETPQGSATPSFVPVGFLVPGGLDAGDFRLLPLGPEHNERDHAAWTGSIAHIRATPGFVGRSWPPEAGMTLEANLRDLEKHAADFAQRRGFTYTVLEGRPSSEVIGCVYIYPDRDDAAVTAVSSWVRADRAALDVPLYAAVRDWLAKDWPFARVDYAAR